MCRVIAVENQKGGVGKTTMCVNLGIGLARAGKKVLLVEANAQGSMAVGLGIAEPDELDVTLVNIMEKVINDEDVEPGEGIIHHTEGIDFIPANIELAGLETALVNVMSRETILRQYLNSVKGEYDFHDFVQWGCFCSPCFFALFCIYDDCHAHITCVAGGKRHLAGYTGNGAYGVCPVCFHVFKISKAVSILNCDYSGTALTTVLQCIILYLFI